MGCVCTLLVALPCFTSAFNFSYPYPPMSSVSLSLSAIVSLSSNCCCLPACPDSTPTPTYRTRARAGVDVSLVTRQFYSLPLFRFLSSFFVCTSVLKQRRGTLCFFSLSLPLSSLFYYSSYLPTYLHLLLFSFDFRPFLAENYLFFFFSSLPGPPMGTPNQTSGQICVVLVLEIPLLKKIT